jgi:hypothetical protein
MAEKHVAVVSVLEGIWSVLIMTLKFRIDFFPCPVFMLGVIPYNGPGSVVGIVTEYGLDGQGIESRWRRDFPHLSRPSLEPTQPPVHWVPCFSGVKNGRYVTLTPHASSAVAKERV